MTCGYEYGRATLYMPVVRLDDIGKGTRSGDPTSDDPPLPDDLDRSGIPMAPPRSDDGSALKGNNLVFVFLGILLLLLVVVGAIVGVLFL